MWAASTNGKAIPMDPDPVGNGNLILETGKTNIARPPELHDDPGGDRWVSHFVTCPQAKTWRKT